MLTGIILHLYFNGDGYFTCAFDGMLCDFETFEQISEKILQRCSFDFPDNTVFGEAKLLSSETLKGYLSWALESDAEGNVLSVIEKIREVNVKYIVGFPITFRKYGRLWDTKQEILVLVLDEQERE